MSHETVGSLLAVIANSLNDGLRIMMFADKRAWGPDEFELLRLLEETLDEAKKDFQELPTLVNGRFYYEEDRKSESLLDLRTLCTRFELHAQALKDWVRSGDITVADLSRDTLTLRQDLHGAQCRAARRIHNEAEAHTRCLGALQVFRAQQRPTSAEHAQQTHPQDQHPQQSQQSQSLHQHQHHYQQQWQQTQQQQHRGRAEMEEIASCNATGKFERFGERDIAFVCDYCDGFLVWEDLRSMPSTRAVALTEPHNNNNTSSGVVLGEPLSAAPTTTTAENWQARDFSMSTTTANEEKMVVFAPLAIANHLPPEPGEWQARILCPYCDDYYYEEPGDDGMERVRYTQDERGFEDVRHFQEHLEWNHTSLVPSASKCVVM
ncbi:Uu.00g093990.m01.CDS01 [Anthostomella pinea]|uniref:Uu.00g093990.m01.CDS01 n=1 Tax=Anthostomella pinea TaxID=933095 RepID=A0AAI8VI39_9PEZI|nr:Uu.00g093990.m01.CDS01 [Anthostomella pinea]